VLNLVIKQQRNIHLNDNQTNHKSMKTKSTTAPVASVTKVPATPVEKKAKLCGCGCEAETKGGEFLPGHDAKLKYKLVAEAVTGKKRPLAELQNRGWTAALDAKLAKLAKVDQKKAARQVSEPELPTPVGEVAAAPAVPTMTQRARKVKPKADVHANGAEPTVACN
jgi:hypothetical protein